MPTYLVCIFVSGVWLRALCNKFADHGSFEPLGDAFVSALDSSQLKIRAWVLNF